MDEGFVWVSNRNSVEQQFICRQEVNYIARYFGKIAHLLLYICGAGRRSRIPSGVVYGGAAG